MTNVLITMKLSANRLASVTRNLPGLGTAAQSPRRRPAQRDFHPSPFAQPPCKRNFFARNSLLQQDGSEPIKSKETKKVAGANGAEKDGKPGKKRGPLKSSLRRVAIVAEKGDPALVASSGPPAQSDGSTTIRAVCVATSFYMSQVAEILSNHGFLIDPDGTEFDKDDVVHARGLNSGEIFVFASGTLVAWGLPPDVVEKLAITTLLPAAEDPSIETKEVEDLDFEINPEARKTLVKDDGLVVLGTRLEDREVTLNKIAISSGLARSTKLGMLENSLGKYLDSTREIPDLLSNGLSEPSFSRVLILKKTGELLKLRSQLNHYNELTDALPDMLWDSEARLESYYGAIGKALNVGWRIATLNTKLTYAQEVIKAAQDVVNIAERASSEKQSARLEWIIIILITIEVIFGLRHIYIENTAEDVEGAILSELKGIRASLDKPGMAEKRMSPQDD